MTLADIARMLNLAHVPRSITTQRTFPQPRIVVEVPATHYVVCREVVKRFALASDNIRIDLLPPNARVGANEHKYFKFRDPSADAPKTHTKSLNKDQRRTYNRDVVIDFASFVAQ